MQIEITESEKMVRDSVDKISRLQRERATTGFPASLRGFRPSRNASFRWTVPMEMAFPRALALSKSGPELRRDWLSAIEFGRRPSSANLSDARSVPV